MRRPYPTWETASRRLRTAWCMRIATKCPQDGRFRSRPSSTCDYCGYCGLRVGQEPWEYDREHGWDYV